MGYQLDFDFDDEKEPEEFIQVERLKDPDHTSADTVLECAIGKLDHVLLIGIEPSGDYYYATDVTNGLEVNYMADRFKRFLMRQMD